MSKYDSLWKWIQKNGDDKFSLTYAEIEKIAGLPIDHSFLTYKKELPGNTKKYLYFIPMWILATGNLWDGFALSYHGAELVFAVLSMIIVGFVEEMLFQCLGLTMQLWTRFMS